MNRKSSFALVLMIYFLAVILAAITALTLQFLHTLLIVLLSDIVATLVVYFASTIYDNASLYDPYWSVAPMLIVVYFLTISWSVNYLIRKIIVTIIVFAWGIRLTWNWASSWRGIDHEDWRYRMYRRNKPESFWVINLFGIQLMPTFLVYLGCLSLYPALVVAKQDLNVLDILGCLITSAAILIESISDKQLRKFIEVRKSKQEIMTSGLWRYSRHPNYFGEILFWCGLYVFALASNFSYWWVIIGPIGITILFNYISIPLMEERNLLNRPKYAEKTKSISKLIPWISKEEERES